MTRRDFFILGVTLFIFAFWYSGIFKYFNLLNNYFLLVNELVKVNSFLGSIINFDIKNYAQEIISFHTSTIGEQSLLSQSLKLENLIFQFRLLSNCKTDNYYCLRFDFATFVSSCLDNDDFDNCLKNKLFAQKQQMIFLLGNNKTRLETKIKVYQKNLKGLVYLSNPFLLLGNILNPSLREGLLTQNLNFDNENLTAEARLKFNKKITNPSTSNEEKITYIERSFKPNFPKSRKSKTKKFSSVSTSSIGFEKTFQELLTTTSLNNATDSNTSTSLNNQQETRKTFIGGGGGNTRQDICNELKNRAYPNLIISEFQFETKDQANDEFIEIYNPFDQEVDLRCWSLEKYAAKSSAKETPTLMALIPSPKFQGKVRGKSFFLITSSSTKEKYQGDLSYPESYSLANNNVIILKKPNGEISDLVGYGNDREKIYTFESQPFLFSYLDNKTIQRKNLKDSDNNSKDFWLRSANPENSSRSRLPRDDFVDLSMINLGEFNIFTTTSDGEQSRYFLNISFKEPQLNISAINYFFDLLIGISTNIFNFNLSDFGSTLFLPQPKFDNQLVNLQTEINKCPTSSTTYYFNLLLKDKLDNENFSLPTITSTTLPEELCNFSEPTSTLTTGKILFSELRIIEGVTNNDGEYIELYNPNKFSVSLNGWSIKKINKNGEIQKTTIVTPQRFKGVIIKPFSYLLLANESIVGDALIQSDVIYPSSSAYGLTFNNGLVLLNDNNQIVDKVCWGEINNHSDCLINPKEAKVFIRKAGKNSTEETLKNEEKDYGNSFDSEVISNNFLLTDPEPQNSSTEEIPPSYFTQEKLSISNEKIIIEFVSPYQKLENANYEIKINDLNNDSLPILNLPTVKPFGEKELIEFNGCSFGLKNNDKIFLILKEKEKVNYFKEFQVENFQCNPMIIKLRDEILSYLDFFSKIFSVTKKIVQTWPW